MLQLFEVSTITTLNQTISKVCTFFNEYFFRKNIGDFSDNEKFSTVIACKGNRFDFQNSCKHVQNFVNMEAILDTKCSHFIKPYKAKYLYELHSYSKFILLNYSIQVVSIYFQSE